MTTISKITGVEEKELNEAIERVGSLVANKPYMLGWGALTKQLKLLLALASAEVEIDKERIMRLVQPHCPSKMATIADIIATAIENGSIIRKKEQ